MVKLFPLCSLILLIACGSAGSPEQTATTTSSPQTAVTASKAPTFEADSAYTYVANQVAFGPRVPNSKAHI